MGCKSFGISQVLIGLHRVGIAGLGDALQKAATSGLRDRDAIVACLLESLKDDNFIPESQLEDYRTALWREYLRQQRQDFSEFYSKAEVVVRGAPGAELDAFLRLAVSVFADFELRPVFSLAPPHPGERNPQLIVGEETIVRGLPDRSAFKNAVRRSLSDW